MKQMTINQAMQLIESKPTPTISIYLATDVKGRDATATLKGNLQRMFRTAEWLVSKTYDGRTKARLLEPLKKSLKAMRPGRAKGGLAIYHNEHFSGVVKIPTHVSDIVVAAESFHLKPVIRCLQLTNSYNILAFRKNAAELFSVKGDGTHFIERVEFPSRIEKLSELRSKKDFEEIALTVLRRLESHWIRNRSPLCLAGPHNLLESFRHKAYYDCVTDDSLIGYIDELNNQTLFSHASKTMENYFSEIAANESTIFRKVQGSSLASTDIRAIALAAARGQVRSLLIAEDKHIWGRFDRHSGIAEVFKEQSHGIGDDLLDDIAEVTILKGGKVTVLPSDRIPGQHAIAAVLRWNDAPSSELTDSLGKSPFSFSRFGGSKEFRI